MLILKRVLYLLLIKFHNCNEQKLLENRKSLPNFRKQIREIIDNKPLLKKAEESNPVVPTMPFDPDNDMVDTYLSQIKTITPINEYEERNFGTVKDDEELKNSSTEATTKFKASFSFIKNDNEISNNATRDTAEIELLSLDKSFEKDLLILQKANQAGKHQGLQLFDYSVINKSISQNEGRSTRRSCISCNNVAVQECNDPKNKLIPSTVCEYDEDLCYSQHTPFGTVDRGCYNVNHNWTTYVCSCNLCNYIAITEMPYVFSTKKDWIENVIELSRTKRPRDSVLKDMSCLRCEVNSSTMTGVAVDNANCLEGNLGTLSTQECADNEICGINAIRSEGYVWRGCVTRPLYNYWWTFCDSDLCNYDSLASVYDKI